MDFSIPRELLDYKKSVVEFAQSNLNSSFVEDDKACRFNRKDWNKCAFFGIQGLAAPKNFNKDNADIDMVRATLAMEGLGYGYKDNGLPLALSAQMWTVQLPLVDFGTEAQKNAYLPNLVSGNSFSVTLGALSYVMASL